jgi:hypothetical protein
MIKKTNKCRKKKDVFIQKRKIRFKRRGEKENEEKKKMKMRGKLFFFHSFIFIVVCFYWIHTLNASASFMKNFHRTHSLSFLSKMTEGKTFFRFFFHSIDLLKNKKKNQVFEISMDYEFTSLHPRRQYATQIHSI